METRLTALHFNHNLHSVSDLFKLFTNIVIINTFICKHTDFVAMAMILLSVAMVTGYDDIWRILLVLGDQPPAHQRGSGITDHCHHPISVPQLRLWFRLGLRPLGSVRAGCVQSQ